LKRRRKRTNVFFFFLFFLKRRRRRRIWKGRNLRIEDGREGRRRKGAGEEKDCRLPFERGNLG